MEVFDDFLRDYVGIGKVSAIFAGFVFEPEDVEVELVALEQLLVGEGPEAVGQFSLVAVSAVAAAL